MGRIFGTDGIRGVAGVDLTINLATQIGKALAQVIKREDGEKPCILIGKDTRISGDMLESALAAGLCAEGVNVVKIGVVPTPAVAHIVREFKADGGVMISASHNSYEDNGIKIFSATGHKLSDSQEEEIEALIFGEKQFEKEVSHSNIGRVEFNHKAREIYCDYIRSSVGIENMPKLKIAIDCSNGSASTTAGLIFGELSEEVILLNNTPDGININKECGSTHMDKLKEYVVENSCDIGIALDGDADRFLAVDNKGTIVDGDVIMAIIGNYLKENNQLKNNTIVATVMSNLGFMKFARDSGINAVATKVGDRYVLENMIENGHNIGGEQSGHIILLDYMTTGDGQLAALMILKIMAESGKSLAELGEIMKVYPQTLVNIRVTPEIRDNYSDNKKVQEKIAYHNGALGDRGRILVRASGTEPLVRVMVEGENIEEVNTIAEDIALVIRELV